MVNKDKIKTTKILLHLLKGAREVSIPAGKLISLSENSYLTEEISAGGICVLVLNLYRNTGYFYRIQYIKSLYTFMRTKYVPLPHYKPQPFTYWFPLGKIEPRVHLLTEYLIYLQNEENSISTK